MLVVLLTALIDLSATDRLVDGLLASTAQIEAEAGPEEALRLTKEAFAQWEQAVRRLGMMLQQPQVDGVNEAFIALFEALSDGDDRAAACSLLRIRLETLRRLEHLQLDSIF